MLISKVKNYLNVILYQKDQIAHYTRDKLSRSTTVRLLESSFPMEKSQGFLGGGGGGGGREGRVEGGTQQGSNLELFCFPIMVINRWAMGTQWTSSQPNRYLPTLLYAESDSVWIYIYMVISKGKWGRCPYCRHFVIPIELWQMMSIHETMFYMCV